MAKCTTFAKKQYGGITKAIESKGLQSLHEEVWSAAINLQHKRLLED